MSFEYRALGDPPDAAEAEAVGRLGCQTFGMPFDAWPDYMERVGPTGFRQLRRRADLVASLAIFHPGQLFGGRAVPMAAIAAVAVAPEHRGGGAGRELMSRMLAEMRESGTHLSALYASTTGFYRKLGYEYGGACHLFELDTTRIGKQPGDLPIHAVDPADHDRFEPLQQAAARESAGFLARPRGMWVGLTRERNSIVHAFLLGDPGSPEGYLIYGMRHGPLKLHVREWVARTPAASRALLRHFAGYRSLGGVLTWRGPATEPMLMHLPEAEAKPRDHELWMLRVIDVRGALEGRGYSADVDATLDLEIADELLPDNAGRIRLEVSGGEGRVTDGGSGALRMDIRGLAPLYSGLHAPRALAGIGLVTGDDASLATATRIFAGPEPWMADRF